jgi:hypothetical protein
MIKCPYFMGEREREREDYGLKGNVVKATDQRT